MGCEDVHGQSLDNNGQRVMWYHDYSSTEAGSIAPRKLRGAAEGEMSEKADMLTPQRLPALVIRRNEGNPLGGLSEASQNTRRHQVREDHKRGRTGEFLSLQITLPCPLNS